MFVTGVGKREFPNAVQSSKEELSSGTVCISFLPKGPGFAFVFFTPTMKLLSEER